MSIEVIKNTWPVCDTCKSEKDLLTLKLNLQSLKSLVCITLCNDCIDELMEKLR